MATKQTAARILCATAAGTLALTGCSAPDNTAAPTTMQRVSLTPQDTLAVTGAGHARALEMSNENTLRMTTSEHAATATTMRVNTDTGDIDEQHQVIVPGVENDPTFSMIDFDAAKIEETAAHAADLAEAKFISEQGTKPAEHTHELSQEMYRSTFALDTLRARLGYGATQLYTVGGERDAHAMWQLGAGSTIGLIDATGEHADDADDSVTPLQGSFPTIERSVGICALDATDAADNTTAEGDAARTITTLNGNDVTTRSGVVISTSGSSALVPRDATSLEEMSVIQATLPHTLDDEQRTPDRGERLVLMGLGEIDCVTHPVASGTPEGTAGIFAAINTELATRTSDYQNSSNALRDYLDEQEQADAGGNDESPARPREDTAAITPVVPEEHGLVAVMDAQGDVAALLDSTEIAAAHPEVAGKDISTVAVDPRTFNPADTKSAGRARQGWFDRLTAPLRRGDDNTTEQTVTLWITYDGIDTVYKTQARLDI